MARSDRSGCLLREPAVGRACWQRHGGGDPDRGVEERLRGRRGKRRHRSAPGHDRDGRAHGRAGAGAGSHRRRDRSRERQGVPLQGRGFLSPDRPGRAREGRSIDGVVHAIHRWQSEGHDRGLFAKSRSGSRPQHDAEPRHAHYLQRTQRELLGEPRRRLFSRSRKPPGNQHDFFVGKRFVQRRFLVLRRPRVPRLFVGRVCKGLAAPGHPRAAIRLLAFKRADPFLQARGRNPGHRRGPVGGS
mmetsp:Transcript_29360/g.61107  ORF Transcript_29360/g.61107 Transcript_29360/m.61107 type:complete len:244 (-) Transcript_29360:666-1397(-)